MTITSPKGQRDVQVTLLGKENKETSKEELSAKSENLDEVLSSWESLIEDELTVDITNIEKRLLSEFKKATSGKS